MVDVAIEGALVEDRIAGCVVWAIDFAKNRSVVGQVRAKHRSGDLDALSKGYVIGGRHS